MTKSRSEKDMAEQKRPTAQQHQGRARSSLHAPSIYTLRTNDSQTSLVSYSYYHRTPFSGSGALTTLRRDGVIDGMFPNFHLLRNVTWYMRFASASYGSHFLKVMGMMADRKAAPRAADGTQGELRSFAHHTRSDAGGILLASFVDPQGGSDSTGCTNTGVPLVHYISLDHASKAVVLSCRGTLGFEDVLADMACDYDDMVWRGKAYKVHRGIHASARRLLYGGDGRVLATLKRALEAFGDYGLVLTGHSLGGGVTSLLGIMLSEPGTAGPFFFTTSAETHGGRQAETARAPFSLPPGRPIHVFAYGPPSTMSASLRKATRGLITSIVHGRDLVPFLSLGVLHDFQAVALAFKADNSEAKAEVRQHIWEAFRAGLADSWYDGAAKAPCGEENQWALATLKTLRASMMSHKLVPPGEVFVIEQTRVLPRDAFLRAEARTGPRTGEELLVGQPAKRVVLTYVRDVERRFREVRFAASMLTDHNPAKYEDALELLHRGVTGS
jgi:hypothetical protein